MQVFDANATRRGLPYLPMIERMQALFSSGLAAPDRHHHRIANTGEADGTLLLMPVWSDSIGCVKIVTATPGNARRSLPAIAGTVLVFERRTGRHIAILDGSILTARRTAAASALGASFLARDDAETLLIIGSGKVAAELAPAFAAVRPIRRVLVWSPTVGNAQALASRLSEGGFDASATRDLAEAVGGADIISAATLSTAPLIKGEWLRAGQHIDLVGAFTPQMREADDFALQRARIFVDTPFAAHEAGELAIPLARGAISPGDILGDLHDLATRKTGRGQADEITLFKSVGNAVMDLAAAETAMRTMGERT